MDVGLADLVTAVPAAVVGVCGAWLGFKGRREEASVTFNGDLLKAQAERIDRLEERQAELEAKLDDTRSMLRYEQDRTHQLRRALEDAIGWLRDFIEWAGTDMSAPAPHPDVKELAATLHDSYVLPVARNPPDG